jgi:hypothetical protein
MFGCATTAALELDGRLEVRVTVGVEGAWNVTVITTG